MLSILIPTYNYDCQPLVDALCEQASALGIVYEIIVFDDASTVQFHFHDCRTIHSPHNIGRACGRNALARAAQYPYLLFIDSDSLPAQTDYLSRYLSRINANKNRSSHIFLTGGRVYRPSTDLDHSLLPSYGIRERVVRECQPMTPFISCNFLIDRETMLQHPFDESFTGYGHEDTLFGIELLRSGIRYTAIDNPVVHCHIEDNATFLQKNREALRTLHSMAETCPELREISRMVRVSSCIPFRLPLFLSVVTERVIMHFPSARLLQVYKFLYYNSL